MQPTESSRINHQEHKKVAEAMDPDVQRDLEDIRFFEEWNPPYGSLDAAYRRGFEDAVNYCISRLPDKSTATAEDCISVLLWTRAQLTQRRMIALSKRLL